MMKTKETIKSLGNFLRSSNPAHQAALRQMLVDKGIAPTSQKAMPKRQFFLFSAVSFALLVLLVLTRHPATPIAYDAKPEDTMVYATAGHDSGERTPTNALNTGGIDLGSTLSNTGAIVNEYADTFAPQKAVRQAPTDPDIVDYAKEHGDMLDTSTVIGLMTTERDLSTNVASLLEGFGGHVSSINTQDGVETLTGLVPGNSYFLLKEQLQDLVHGDRFFSEYLNATDLTPSAVTIDTHLDEVTASIDDLNKQIAETKDDAKKASLQKEVSNLELQRENLHKSRSELSAEVAYTSVSIFITEIPSFTKARTPQDFRQLVSGFETPGVFEQMWINVLIITSYLLQAFSYTFWLLIPLGIWLITRARTRHAWKALD